MEILRYAAFTTDPAGGNPAGVVLDDAEVQRVAAEVGYSETAFLVPSAGELRVRCFSPLAEVPFCGHATIATAVAHAERHGPDELRLVTAAGSVAVTTERDEDGVLVATLVSVPTRTEALADDLRAALLAALRWSAGDLDPALPPRVACAGARHLVVAAGSRSRLADLDYDFPALSELMDRAGWKAAFLVCLVWRESPAVFHARNPFPPGGVVEDPATGAAAAAFGGYLQELGAGGASPSTRATTWAGPA